MLKVSEDVIRHVIKGVHIPPKPEILNVIQALIDDENSSLEAVGDCLCDDVGLSAGVLKTLNSPFYGMANTITDVKQAVMLLGINSIKSLVASYEIRRAFQGDSCISLERFWDNASDVANAMVFVGKRVNPNIPLEDLHVAGLFHDCGLPAMAIQYPDYVDTLIESNDNTTMSLVEIEEARYKCNHAVIGYYIASSWGLPKPLCNVILQHHELDVLQSKVGHNFLWMYSCLKAADNLVEKTRRFKTARDWPFVEKDVLSSMGMTSLDYSDAEDDFLALSSE